MFAILLTLRVYAHGLICHLWLMEDEEGTTEKKRRNRTDSHPNQSPENTP